MAASLAAASKMGRSSWLSASGSTRRSASSRRDELLLGHLHGDAHRGQAGALAGAGLQHVEPAALDGELDVLHVAVVALQLARAPPRAAGRCSGQRAASSAIFCGVRMPATTSSPWAFTRNSP